MTRLLVTGGAGFFGAHFIRSWRAAHPADEIVNVDLLTYAGSRERLRGLEDSTAYRFVQADICDAQAMREALTGTQVVVHFAAETHVDRSITDAAPFLRTNVEGTYTLLRAAQAAGITRFVHVSTDEVYGPVLEGAVDETAPLLPSSPYAASKAAGDLLVKAMHLTAQIPTLIVRPTNIFGPGQFPEKFIPLTITNALSKQPVPIYGDGQQRRGWLHVEDACAALRTVIERGQAGEVYNVGSGHERTNLETAGTILSLLGQPADLIQLVADRPAHDRRYAMRDERTRALGWRPKMRFEDGLQQTIAWYRDHADWWRPLVQKLREDPYHWLNRSAGSSAQQTLRADR